MPVFFSNAARYLVVWPRSFGVTGSPMVSTSSPDEPLLPDDDDPPQAASSGPATAAVAPAASSFRRLIIGRLNRSDPDLAFPRARDPSSVMPCLPSWPDRPPRGPGRPGAATGQCVCCLGDVVLTAGESRETDLADSSRSRRCLRSSGQSGDQPSNRLLHNF